MRHRVAVLDRLRRLLADEADALSDMMPPRAPGETLVAEVLPVLDACRFLRRSAPRLLRRRPLGLRGRPLWLAGSTAEVHREAHGVVLVLAPSNYPFMLPAVQALQALAAGNAVLLKPAPGWRAALARFAELAAQAGLPDGLLHVLDDGAEVGEEALAAGVDFVVLTGSATTGRTVQRRLADRLVPSVMELSGNDAVFVLPGADLDMTAAALCYGLRFNGGATCIAPRRVFCIGNTFVLLRRRLGAATAVAALPGVWPHARERARAERLLDEAQAAGCSLIGARAAPDAPFRPVVVVAERASKLALLRDGVFAPVLTLLPAADEDAALSAAAGSAYALGASVFGPADAARALAARVDAGVVTVNDLIVPTADPRLPFGGRGRSGFGVTRGAEGLLQMTTIKVIARRSGRFRPHYAPPTADDAALYRAFIQLSHGGAGDRLRALPGLVRGLFKAASKTARSPAPPARR